METVMVVETTETVVGRLVGLHGEGGVCPTADEWRAILACEARPLHLLNLLKFHGDVGEEAYRRYRAGNTGPFARAGGEALYFGHAAVGFGSGEKPDWDAAILTRYPSADALAEMWLDPEFVAAHESRMEAVAASQVLVFAT
jgi:uncharacterized protein (DUF1330 family)